jgi:5'-3' exonuclease
MIAIIDVNHSFHKSFFVFSKWDNSDINTETGQEKLMRKAVTDLFASVNKLWQKPKDVYFCFDSHTWRKDFTHEYKAHRDKKPNGFYKVINSLYEIMKSKEFKTFKVNQAESDDCIAFLTKTLSGHKLVISADEDMHQLLNDEVVVWNNNVKKPIVFTSTKDEKLYFNFPYEKQIVDPQLSLFKKVILGCSGDGVSALVDKKGVGEKTIEKLYSKLGSYSPESNPEEIKVLLQEGLGFSRDDYFEKYKENVSLVNLDLTSLPESIIKGMIDGFKEIESFEIKQSFDIESLLSGSKYYSSK